MSGKPNSSVPEEDDDFEYEVEPVDENVTAHQHAYAQEQLSEAEKAIDVDAIYRELDSHNAFDGALESIRARFSVRSMIIATTVVAVLLTAVGSGLFSGAGFAILICLSVVGLGAAHAWLNYQESQRQAKLIARREEELRLARGETAPAPTPPATAPLAPGALLKAAFQATPTEALISLVAAGLMVAFLKFAGSPIQAAGAFGTLAVFGFALLAADISVPRPMVLAWWLALFGYALLTATLGVATS